ncbi:DUF924 family protein [Jannaschia seohaensis]|uniref:Uncharacterized conserved protein, DUF924 family n=1 Tax=Jannaschia seohaensis TaxID=475081 RepID=A0A2Y9BAG6_9RHOB|nr:DUF924 family protein [Jannaschia seohaensis]PWJ12136.1 uncharacterized protein (DUF924 family) [Jannaschia seohaensis]SSA51239.1 Uncharacterized conserved protein, DUF924 family [Jannaschia seohaensis]
MDSRAEEVLRFWLEETEPKGWYVGSDALDQEIRDRFLDLWEQATDLRPWCITPRGTLAYLILTDQFPRNMFRGEARAFATDRLARAVAAQAIGRGFDLKVEGLGRQFFYLPLEHSESLPDQARAVRLIFMRLDSPLTLLHARTHREMIRRYGRFPYRNAALARRNSRREAEMLEAGGYGAVLRELQAAEEAGKPTAA